MGRSPFRHRMRPNLRPTEPDGCMLPATGSHPNTTSRTAAEALMHRVALTLAVAFALAGRLLGHVPTGSIAGTVSDQVNAVLPKATVTISNKDSWATRVVQTGGDASASVPSPAPRP